MCKEYYEGKGCTCGAYYYGECGCGVDWTDPEIYKLREQLQQATKERDEAVELLRDALRLALSDDEDWFDLRGPARKDKIETFLNKLEK